jgi:hypothetical protein
MVLIFGADFSAIGCFLERIVQPEGYYTGCTHNVPSAEREYAG